MSNTKSVNNTSILEKILKENDCALVIFPTLKIDNLFYRGNKLTHSILFARRSIALPNVVETSFLLRHVGHFGNWFKIHSWKMTPYLVIFHYISSIRIYCHI